MNKDRAIELAKEVGFKYDEFTGCALIPGFTMFTLTDALKRFATLIAAEEREACAVLCEGEADAANYNGVEAACLRIAAAIRARGQK